MSDARFIKVLLDEYAEASIRDEQGRERPTPEQSLPVAAAFVGFFEAWMNVNRDCPSVIEEAGELVIIALRSKGVTP